MTHSGKIDRWQHGHSFGQERKRQGEGRTAVVVVMTVVMMIVEVGGGLLFGSMALLADGLHMASHAVALTITVFAYVYARRHARDARFSFGTGKVNALGGFSGAILLAVFSLMMVWESGWRLIVPVEIAFDPAIGVAVIGFLVNGVSALVLGGGQEGPARGQGKNHDHNLRAAYLHVMADALTSVLAIFALLAGKYRGLTWMDPLMGIAGAALISRWSYGLLVTTGAVLLDRQGPKELSDAVRRAIERVDGNRVADLHLWSIGPGIYAAELSIVTGEPKSPEYYKTLIEPELGVRHMCVEAHQG